MRFIKLWGLCALVLHLASPAVSAQTSSSASARMVAVETAISTLTQNLLTLQNANAALTQDLQTKSALITSLQSALDKEVADRKAYADTVANNALNGAKSYSDNQLAPVADKLHHFSRSGNNVFITGANVYVRNGMGATVNNGYNGLGNLILGYNEGRGQPASPDVRTGSHNLIVGVGANYARNSSIVMGINNSSGNNFASVFGGTGNSANATYSVVVGGYNNVTSGGWAVILGGRDNTASAQLQHIP